MTELSTMAGPSTMAEPFLSEEVPEALAGERLDRLVSILTGCSRAEAVELVHAGAVLVDGRPAPKSSLRVSVGDRVELLDDPHREEQPPLADPTVVVPVVYADEQVIVIDKPAGLVVHPAPGHSEGTLVNGLIAAFPELADVGEPMRPGIVHRLDRGTSGLMVVARTQGALDELRAQMEARHVQRTYTALVWGHLEHPRGVIDAPIGRSRRHPLRMAVAEDGKQARTRYSVDRSFSEPAALDLLTCELETGRTHQIRVHLRSIGHPVVGDGLYGGRRSRIPADRPFLHARRLVFAHPLSGEEMAFESPLAPDLEAVLAGLS
jgi:23S rRNA pseudouridine1911/1915/1917 synthase